MRKLISQRSLTTRIGLGAGLLIGVGAAIFAVVQFVGARQGGEQATLIGTAYRLVDQTIVDGVVTHETELPITNGRLAIPEVGIDTPLAQDGSFRLSNLPARADERHPTEVTAIFTAPGLGSFTFTHLRLYPGHVGPNLTPQLIDTPRVDDLARGHKGTGPS